MSSITSFHLLRMELSHLGDCLPSLIRYQSGVYAIEPLADDLHGVSWLVAVAGDAFGVAVGAVESVAEGGELAVVVVLPPGEVVDGVGAGVEDALEGEQVDVVVDADRPEGGQQAVGQHYVDGNRQEVATGEDRHCLDEGVERVEGEAGEGRDCLGFVVDVVEVAVDLGMVEEAVEPVGEELVVGHVQQQVQRQHRTPGEGVLRLREVGIAQFDQVDQWRLAEDVQRRPLQVVPVSLPLDSQLLPARREALPSPDVQCQEGESAEQKVEGECEGQRDCASREVFVEQRPLRTERLPVSDEEAGMAVVRAREGHSLLHSHRYIIGYLFILVRWPHW